MLYLLYSRMLSKEPAGRIYHHRFLLQTTYYLPGTLFCDARKFFLMFLLLELAPDRGLYVFKVFSHSMASSIGLMILLTRQILAYCIISIGFMPFSVIAVLSASLAVFIPILLRNLKQSAIVFARL